LLAVFSTSAAGTNCANAEGLPTSTPSRACVAGVQRNANANANQTPTIILGHSHGCKAGVVNVLSMDLFLKFKFMVTLFPFKKFYASPTV
jgi:hypothetical protein